MRFGSALYEAFRRVNGYAMGAVGLLLSIAAYVWLPDAAVPARVFVPAAVVILLVILTLADATFTAIKKGVRLPKVIRAIPPTALYDDAAVILLVESSDLLAHDSMVSVFTRSDDFERFVGVGFVATVQENGLIQVCVMSNPDDSNGELWARVLQNNRDELSHLLVKPSIPRSLNL